MTAKKQHDLVGLEKERAYGDLRASYHLMNVPKILLVVMTALLFAGVALAASPVTMTPEIAFIVGPVHDPAKNPWPWFDRNGSERGLLIGSAMSVEPARMQVTFPYAANPRPFGTGTVSVTNESAIVIGTGTKFLSEYAVGKLIVLPNESGLYCYLGIASIESDTRLTLATGWGRSSPV